jgi:hypothetical protein
MVNDVDMDLRNMGVQRRRRRVWDRTDWAPDTRTAKAKSLVLKKKRKMMMHSIDQ